MNKQFAIFVNIVVALTLLLTTSACNSVPTATTTSQPTDVSTQAIVATDQLTAEAVAEATLVPIPVRIAWQPYASPIFYTIRELKLFEKAGLAPEYVKFTAGPPEFAAFKSNSVDIGMFGTTGMVVGASQDLGYEGFYIQTQSSYTDGLIVRNDSGVKKVEDLKGKKVGYTRGTSSHLGLLQALEKSNMTMDDIQAVALDVTALPAAFANKDIDAAYSWEPWLSKMGKDGTVLLRTHDIGTPTSDIWVVRKAWAKDNAEAMRRIFYAISLANQAYQTDRSIAVAATMENVGIDETTAKKILDMTPVTTFDQLADPQFELSLVSPTGAQSMVQAVADFLFAQTVINTKVDASLYVNGSYFKDYLAKPIQ